jgi:hypothetical protein
MDPSLTDKMDRCVEDVLAKHKDEKDFDKSNAIAICRKSMEANTMNGLTLLPVTETDLKQWGHNLTAEAIKGELVKATNVVLAHAERNANGDGITAENIATLAGSLNLKPLDLDHNQTEVIGFFVNPRQQDWGDVTGGELATDLVVFAGRFPEASGDLQTGKRYPSIEARSSEVMCSICDQWFQSTADYCEHLQPLLLGSKLDDNVTRWHKNMRAIGGGAVTDPAGAETTFGDTFMVVAHVTAEIGEGKGVGGPQQGVGGADKCVCPQCGYEAEHERGVPCAGVKCPKCGVPMGGSVAKAEKETTNVLAQEETMPDKELNERLAANIEKLGVAEARIVELETANTGLEAKVQEHIAEAQAFIVKSRVATLAASGMTEESLKQINDQLPDMDDTVFDMLAEMQKALSAKPEPKVEASLHIGDDEPKPLAEAFSVFDVEVTQ